MILHDNSVLHFPSALGMDDSQVGRHLVYTGSSNPLPPCSPEQATSHTKGPNDTPCSRRTPLPADRIVKKRQFERDSNSDDEQEVNSSGANSGGAGSGSGGGVLGGGHYAKKQRVVWTQELHIRFLQAVNHLGIKDAVPKTILPVMNVEGMTRENIASHLQKYRLYLKKLAGYGPNDKVPMDVLQKAQEQASQQVLFGMLTQQGAPGYPMGMDADDVGMGKANTTPDALLGNMGGVFLGPRGAPMGPWMGPGYTAPPFTTQPAAFQFSTGLPEPTRAKEYDAPITTRDLQYPPWLPISLVANPLSFAEYGPMARPFMNPTVSPALFPPSLPPSMPPSSVPPQPSMAPSGAPSNPSTLTALAADARGFSMGVTSLHGLAGATEGPSALAGGSAMPGARSVVADITATPFRDYQLPSAGHAAALVMPKIEPPAAKHAG